MAQKVKTNKIGLKKNISLAKNDGKGAEKTTKSSDSRFAMFKSKKALIIEIVAVVLIAVVVAILVMNRKPSTTQKLGDEKTVSKIEIKNKLNVDIKDPENGDNVKYGIEGDNIAKVSYKKKVSNGNEMNFIMRTSYSTEDIENSIGLDVEFAYTPIMMTVVCNDGSEIPVEAKVALDDSEEMKYMKALWYDNDKYYSMVTDNLVTREDFLQEVNRVIIANHEEF